MPLASVDNSQPGVGHLRGVRAWLVIVAVMIVAMILVGGATRLTESGLSIVEWKPVTGTIPPLSAQAWSEAFEAYKTIPQYREINRGMSLDEFKTIYLVGMEPPFSWPGDRRRVPAAVPLLPVARRLAGLAARAVVADLCAWRTAGGGRLVDGGLRPVGTRAKSRNTAWPCI